MKPKLGRIAMAAAIIFASGVLAGSVLGPRRAPAPVIAAPPTCEDAISRAGAMASRLWLTSFGGQSFEAKVELARGRGYVLGSAHGRTPQEAMARAMEIVQ